MEIRSLKDKNIFLLILILSFITFVVLLISSACSGTTSKTVDTSVNTTDKNSGEEVSSISNDKNQQILEVVARSGGYYPDKIYAKAGVPTILIMRSRDAFGCERAFVLPQYKFSTVLPENGDTDFDLGVLESGTKILGVCSMGMYYFEVLFE